ncbi:hypothetical protein O0I10_004543 [Lichtheimia ornata]|uniref:Uncharacterized protein n=1 Tax=Lichtheimia ornata TaxID=688661 RepID=A0AAD7V6S9_9FUNG|nr:uncharacterized protein O0I10_004543 [Lichtheimia ornata]KAJ8659566.1 hypothetical protein O0I10_004543 [Lichtheimia ornata]
MFSTVMNGIRMQLKRAEAPRHSTKNKANESFEESDFAMASAIHISAAGRGHQQRPTAFGISRDSTDDFIQKDLISSSWY